MRQAMLAILIALLLASACRQDGTGTDDLSWFRASLSGEVSGEYEGIGDFSTQRDHGDTPHYFRIDSRGLDSGVEEFFHLRWPDDRRPTPGTYPLVPHTDPYGSARGVTAMYLWKRGDNVSEPAGSELYVATSGVVEITKSSEDEIEGTIQFSGVQVTRMGPLVPERDDPRHQPRPDAPTIQVRGTFRVTRFDIDRWRVRND